MRLCVGIASAGRRRTLEVTLRHLARQSRLPDTLYLCAVGEDPNRIVLEALPFPVVQVPSAKGLTIQRNAILDAAADADAILFLDDDFLCAADYLARAEDLLTEHPDIAMLTGRVLADGIKGPGLSVAEAESILEYAPRGTDDTRDVHNGYGCNMVVRMTAAVGLRFDEGLPLYGWLEDVDFSRRLAERGRVVRADALRGIHLGVKSGRSPGRQLGYSQIANPVRLVRAGTMAPHRALSIMLRNILANVVRSPRPEPWVDRYGRLRGNLHGLADLVLGRLDAMKAATMGAR